MKKDILKKLLAIGREYAVANYLSNEDFAKKFDGIDQWAKKCMVDDGSFKKWGQPHNGLFDPNAEIKLLGESSGTDYLSLHIFKGWAAANQKISRSEP